MKYYAIANKQTGESIVIDNLPTDRLGAEKEAKRVASKEGYQFQYVRVAANAQKQGNTLTKFKKHRDRYGKNPKRFSSVI